MIQALVAIVLVVLAARAAAMSRPAAAAEQTYYTDDYVGEGEYLDPSFDVEESQEPDPFEAIAIQMDPRTHIPANVTPDQAARNLRAVLDTIRYCEGTAGQDGYRTMFGYRYFDSFEDHPRQYFPFTDQAGRQLRSSAAGAYQIIVKTWDSLRARLDLPDFSPESQDLAAIELIRERGALEDARAGRIQAVAAKCAPVWASLPGANVAQPMRTLPQVVAAFQQAGGTVTT